MPNIRKTGIPFSERNSWYHTMLQMDRWKFLLVIFAVYIFVNLMFALLYLTIGVDHLAGMSVSTTMEKFGEAFFFSTQIFTPVGYGQLADEFYYIFRSIDRAAKFCINCGLLYDHFSRPKAFLKFSHNAGNCTFSGWHYTDVHAGTFLKIIV